MACGATLKRSMEFEALLSPQSPKRRRCNPLPGTPSTPSPQRCNLRPSVDSPSHSMSPAPTAGGDNRLTPEQIFQNLRHEYSRIQRRRQLEGAFNQSEAASTSDAPSPSSALTAPCSPPGGSRKDQPWFTLRQVSFLCERLIKDHEEKIREEYEQILNTKLAEQYESFVKFTQDQIMRRYGARPASCERLLLHWRRFVLHNTTPCNRTKGAMASVNMEEMEPLPTGQAGRREEGEGGCCDNFKATVSRWMLPEKSRDSYLQRANCCPPPVFIILVSIAELAVFIYYAVSTPQKQWVTLDQAIWESPLTYRADRRWEAWRFFSYMFVHAGVEHILGNLLMQLILGIPLELVHKGFEVGMVYMAGVLAGSLASSIFDPHSALVGASGGVYALLGGYFMNAVVNFREMIPLLGVFRIIAILSIVGTDVGFAIYRRFLTEEAGLQVSFVAHIGGAVAGMSIGYVFFSDYDQKLLKDPRFWMCIAGYVIFMIAAVLFNVFLSPAPEWL
ncbi:hypothetical protein NHX12_001183 [Muraenolepis orangiensis]|uniref:Rhomboid-related protein 2 n=1 Tax=Muraenolepis orangiensis TaxID=630683 RepID=A0A9Q0DZZ6_9TELE|nr:hypothetical protein NHX12_001183 [Muraenolepis orangiensis]